MVILLLAAIAALVDPPPSETITGQATASDGDSFRMNGERFRLVGIDAPELDQICGDRDGRNWNCGTAARQTLASILGRGPTTCTPDGRDRYGRYLVHCFAGLGDVGKQMIASGMAISFGEYRTEEATARREGHGLWQGKFENPQDWRNRYGFIGDYDLVGWLRGWWLELTGATKLR